MRRRRAWAELSLLGESNNEKIGNYFSFFLFNLFILFLSHGGHTPSKGGGDLWFGLLHLLRVLFGHAWDIYLPCWHFP
jgi:hypothetical protein